jgi:O-antigen/teichoic acid export membrane protein
MMPLRATNYRFDVLGVLIWAFIPVSVTYIFSTLLTARERMMRMNRFFLVGIAIDLLLNLLLIPTWQALGSAIAAVVTQIFIGLAMVWLCWREFGFRVGSSGMLRIIGFAAFVVGLDYVLFEAVVLPWGIKFSLALALGLVGLLLFQLVDLKRAQQAIKSGGKIST